MAVLCKIWRTTTATKMCYSFQLSPISIRFVKGLLEVWIRISVCRQPSTSLTRRGISKWTNLKVCWRSSSPQSGYPSSQVQQKIINLFVPFCTLGRHIRGVWLSQGSLFGEIYSPAKIPMARPNEPDRPMERLFFWFHPEGSRNTSCRFML